MSRRALAQGGTLPLTGSRYGIGLSWDKTTTSVDLDLQAVVVSNTGVIMEAVYYNRLEVLDKALAHTGDDTTGDGAGCDETIWVNLQRLRSDVRMVIFVVASHSCSSLCQVADMALHVVERWQGQVVESVKLESRAGGVVPVAHMFRSVAGEWGLSMLKSDADSGHHFMDILEPTLGDIIRKRIKGAPRRQKVSFPMSKGTTADLPTAKKLQRLCVGIGWDMGSLGIDLDVSAVLFGQIGQKLGAVYYNNKQAYGLVHTGDNETGEGDGDDESIVVDLSQVPASVAQIFFIVNIYTKGVTFKSLKSAHCRVSNDVCEQMAKYSLDFGDKGSDGSGLVIARLMRNPKRHGWVFQAVGSFCHGRKWMDHVCLKEMNRLFHMSASEIAADQKPEAPSKRAAKGGAATKRAFRSTVCLDQLERTISGGSQHVRVGVGWDILASKQGYKTSVDLDVAAVFFHRDGRDLGAIDYENPEEYGMRHSGDNETGEGDGDDEIIDVDLRAIPEDIAQVFFVVTVYTKGMSFKAVENAYCRVINDLGDEVMRHDLTGSCSASAGLVIAQLFKHPDQGWTFKKRSSFCDARTWLDPVLMLELRQLFRETRRQYDPEPECPQPQFEPSCTMWRSSTWAKTLGVASSTEESDASASTSTGSFIVSL